MAFQRIKEKIARTTLTGRHKLDIYHRLDAMLVHCVENQLVHNDGARNLTGAFGWTRTPEGRDFWASLNRVLIEHDERARRGVPQPRMDRARQRPVRYEVG